MTLNLRFTKCTVENDAVDALLRNIRNGGDIASSEDVYAYYLPQSADLKEST